MASYRNAVCYVDINSYDRLFWVSCYILDRFGHLASWEAGHDKHDFAHPSPGWGNHQEIGDPDPQSPQPLYQPFGHVRPAGIRMLKAHTHPSHAHQNLHGITPRRLGECGAVLLLPPWAVAACLQAKLTAMF